MCNHNKLDGIRNRGFANEYRLCRSCKKRIYKYNKIKRMLAQYRTRDIIFIEPLVNSYYNEIKKVYDCE